jgi:hypothetical protein
VRKQLCHAHIFRIAGDKTLSPDISQIICENSCNILIDNELYNYFEVKKDYRVFLLRSERSDTHEVKLTRVLRCPGNGLSNVPNAFGTISGAISSRQVSGLHTN